MNRSSFIKLFTATAAVLSLAATPALAQDPLSQGYGGDGDNPNEVCPEGTAPVGGNDIGISDSPGVAPDGGAGGLECADVLGDTVEGGDTPSGEGGNTPISDPGDIAGDSGSGSDDPVETASATASDPADPPAAEPAAARPVDSLPFTGADVTLLGAMGVGLFLLGLGLSLLTHRRSRLSL